MITDNDRLRDGQTAEAIGAALQEKGIAFPPEAALALQSGNLIAAIKVLREANPGLNLREAKEAVADLQPFRSTTGADQARDASVDDLSRVPTVVEGDSGGHGALLVAVFVVAVAAVWWLFSGGG